MNTCIAARASLLIAVAVSLSSAASAAAPATPAAEAADAVKITAVVEAIDPKTRKVTLKGPRGDLLTFTAGPGVRNLDQVKRGDRVVLEYFQAFALALEPKEAGIRARRATAEFTRARPGERPAGEISDRVDVVATVQAVDRKKRTVTLRGPTRTLTLKVSDAVDLKRLKVGDEVHASYVESLAVSVWPAPEVSGTVRIESTSPTLGVGAEWGHGTLTLNDGSTHKFKVRGVSVVDVGISNIHASGEVYKLVDLKDFAGSYVAAEAGVALAEGGSGAVLRNAKGVVMRLRSTQKGIKLTLAPEGTRVELVE
jgi:Cu/Ag efflux protein CusF